MKDTIAVDLDGTLAHYDGWSGDNAIGQPVPAMLSRVKAWLAQGKKVAIFTARADNQEAINAVRQWLDKHGLEAIETITNRKLPEFSSIYDDRAVGVVRNKGTLIGQAPSPRKLHRVRA